MSRPLSVGIVGVGAIARDEHLPGWLALEHVRVDAVADTSAAARESVAQRFGVAATFADHRELLAKTDVDIVDICLPSALHAQVAIDCLAAGRHVYCEKPMATCLPDALAMLAAAQQSGRKLMVAQCFRYAPSVLMLREYLHRFPLGDVYYARAQWLRRRRVPARPGFTERRLSGGGPLFDLGVHLFDLAWWLIGCPAPLSVSGATFDRLIQRDDLGGEWGQWDPASTDVEDFAVGQVRFAGGAVLTLETSWLAFQAEREMKRLELYGTQGGAVWPDNVLTGERNRKPWDLRLAPATGRNMYHAAIAAFAQAVVDDTPVPIPPWQTAAAIAVLDALSRSSAAGRELPVEPLPSAE